MLWAPVFDFLLAGLCSHMRAIFFDFIHTTLNIFFLRLGLFFGLKIGSTWNRFGLFDHSQAVQLCDLTF
jgi:hypothetical protein